MNEHDESCDTAKQKLKRIEDQLIKLPLIFQKVVQGDFSERPQLLDGDDEMARLILAFRFMMEDLERAHKERENREAILEQEVLKKTKEIQKNEKSLEMAQKIAHIGNWEWDVKSDVIIWSNELYNIFGIKREDFVSNFLGYLQRIHPDDRERVKITIQRMLKSKQRSIFDHKLVRPDGGERIVHAIAEVELDEKGEIVKMFGTASDITDFKLQELSLKEERDRIRAILGSVGEGLIVVDQYFQIMLINPAAQKELGIGVGEAIGADIRNLVPVWNKKQRLDDSDTPFAEALVTGKVVLGDLNSDYYFVRSDQTKFPVSLVVTPLRGETGLDAFGLVVVFRNITDEKKFDEAKINFISVASHQLRTPLTPMRWFSEMLLSGDLGEMKPEQKKLVEDIYKSVDRMVNLINLLLQIARVETGRVKVVPAMINILDVVNEVVTSLKTVIESKQHVIVVTSEPKDFPSIPMDKEIIWQVFQNLITNALRYSPPKEKIEISVVVKGDVVECSVKDHGIGIPKDEQGKIFEKFFRASNAFRMVPEGTGLGLSLVKSIVDDLGGKVWFETVVGKGTTFYFTIPLKGVSAREGEVGLAV
jgi:PAS domain S-box-containing protein